MPRRPTSLLQVSNWMSFLTRIILGLSQTNDKSATHVVFHTTWVSHWCVYNHPRLPPRGPCHVRVYHLSRSDTLALWARQGRDHRVGPLCHTAALRPHKPGVTCIVAAININTRWWKTGTWLECIELVDSRAGRAAKSASNLDKEMSPFHWPRHLQIRKVPCRSGISCSRIVDRIWIQG